MILGTLSHATVVAGLRPLNPPQGASEEQLKKPESKMEVSPVQHKEIKTNEELVEAYEKNTKPAYYDKALQLIGEVRELSASVASAYAYNSDYAVPKARNLCAKTLLLARSLRGNGLDYVWRQPPFDEAFDGIVPSLAVTVQNVAMKGLKVLDALYSEEAEIAYKSFQEEICKKLDIQPIVSIYESLQKEKERLQKEKTSKVESRKPLPFYHQRFEFLYR